MKPEVKVGLMFILSIVLVSGFAFYLGVFNPFSNTRDLQVAYNFAGGVEVGSPVRVMGIRVGRVKNIRFEPDLVMPSGEEVKLIVTISVDKRAWPTIREDSQFYINLAGVIGEKFIEISPGSMDERKFKPGEIVRGEDPPRIDQLISQSYGLAGKIFEFVESNESSVIDTIQMMNNLVANLNSLLKQVDKTTGDKDIQKMLKNLAKLTDDMAHFTGQARTEEGEKTLGLIKELLWRLEDLDADAIRKFLQKEGIRARMF